MVKILDNFDDLHAELTRSGLVSEPSTEADIFCTLPWFENLARYGLNATDKDQHQCQLLLAHDTASDNLVCLPLLGSATLQSLSNYYSSLYGPLVWQPATGKQSALTPSTWQAMGQHLGQHPARWPLITLSPLDTEATFLGSLQTGLRQAGCWTDRFFCFGNWYLVVGQRSFATYAASLPSALRHSIERGQRRLAKQGTWGIHIQQSPDAGLEEAIAHFVQVYDQSWKSAEPTPQFIPQLIRMAATQGWLRLGVLMLGGQAIAAQLWLVKSGKASIYKLAYVKGFERLSAGSVLTHALMRQVIDIDQVAEVDYLTGDDAYKRDWMSHRRERWGLVAFNPRTLRGLWLAGKHFVGKFFKRSAQA
jgi:hypothetical protein